MLVTPGLFFPMCFSDFSKFFFSSDETVVLLASAVWEPEQGGYLWEGWMEQVPAAYCHYFRSCLNLAFCPGVNIHDCSCCDDKKRDFSSDWVAVGAGRVQWGAVE